MRIIVENFGPIRNGDIEVQPLTIIIGNNNLGKSYLAQLIYVFLTLTKENFGGGRYYFDSLTRRVYVKAYYSLFDIDPIKKILYEDRSNNLSLEKTTMNVLNDTIKRVELSLNETMKLTLERTFGMLTDELINVRSNKSNIEFFLSNNVTINTTIEKSEKVKVKIKCDKKKIHNMLVNFIKENNLNLRDLRRTTDIEKITSYLYNIIFAYEEDISKYLIESYYIPAGRAGLIEGYEAIVDAYMSLSTEVPFRGVSIPPLSGITAQFYRMYLQFPSRGGPFSKLAESFNEIFKGEILFDRETRRTPFRKIVYRFKVNGKWYPIDLRHAASMIKELVPIYFTIKNLATKNSSIIIEEPESHLHPGAQIKLLDLFSNLIRNNLNLIITTHSDTILRKMSLLIGNYITKKTDKMYLNPENVGLYWLEETEKGSVLKNVPLSGVGADYLPTFDDIIKQLYEEEVLIQEELQMVR